MKKSASELDESRVKGTEIRQKGHAEFVTRTENNAAEMEWPKLAESWDNQSSKLEEHQKSSAEEILAIYETTKLLNDDDALELFKATLTNPSSVSTIAEARRAIDELCWSSRMLSNSVSNLKLISVHLNGRSVDFSKVISMMVALFEVEQGEDDEKRRTASRVLARRRTRPRFWL